MTDEDKRPIAEAIYNFRIKHNLLGDNKEDWKRADRIITELELDHKLRADGKVVSYYETDTGIEFEEESYE